MPRLFLPRPGKGKRVVYWGVALLAAAQLALWCFLEWRRPEVRDPLYTYRLQSLKARLAEAPGSPLVLLLGSSRTKYGLSPGAMKLVPPPGAPRPVVYNFGVNGMGSIRELMYLRRLLAEGIRPDWLLLETWPAQWPEDGFCGEPPLLFAEDELHCGDAALVCRYFWRKPTLLARALTKNLVPTKTYRSRLLAGVPSLLPLRQLQELEQIGVDCQPVDPAGWFPLGYGARTPGEIELSLRRGRDQMQPLVDPLRIDPRSDSALREVLTICRERGIKLTLFMMPEHSAARGWYSPQARALTQSYLADLCREFKVAVVDTRDWLPDPAFTDFCHMWCWAATDFSERFGREVIQPILEGRAVGQDFSREEKSATQ
jgi:hypothetical protein